MSFIRHDKALNFMRKALFSARLFSKDPSTKVFCIMLDSVTHATLAESWNGFVKGWKGDTPETWSNRELKMRAPVRHAERNAIDFSARNGVKLEGSICIVTFMPCRECAASLAQIGVTGIVTMRPDYDHPRWGESFRDSKALIDDLEIPIYFLDPEEVLAYEFSIGQ